MREESHPPIIGQQGYPGDHAIAFCTDRNYWPHVATAIRSLLIQSHAPLPDIYVFYEREDQQWMGKLNKLARAHKQTIYFRKFGLELIENADTKNRFGPAAYFRIHLPELLEKYSYLLYLDSDLIAASDFTSIFSQQPTGSTCIAARPNFKDESFYHNQRLGRPLDMPYFNSGVLLIDAVRWRKRNCTEGIMSILRDSADMCIYPDQDALNFFFQGHFHALPHAYNVTRRFYEKLDFLPDYNDPEEEQILEDAAKAPILLHYTSTSKPWHLHNKHPLKHQYRYLRGRFHWYPYALGISIAESLLELRQNAQEAARSFIQKSKSDMATNTKKFVFLCRPSGSLGRLRLRPSFEDRLARESSSSLKTLSAMGIYRLVNDHDEVMFIGCGNISDGVNKAVGKG